MPSIIQSILKARGLTTKQQIYEFLNPDYEQHSHDPFLLPDMEKATKRINQAIKHKEKIVVYGDYDIDGLSATALLLDALSAMGAEVEAYIPDRFDEGYGINTEALQKIQQEGASLVVTVDCGSISFEPIAWANQSGLDVVVTDHHETAKQLPEAVAIINPKRADSSYPFNDLAGVGVAFKLVQALQAKYGLLPAGREKWLLDLVALGTVCDVVKLLGENRMMVKYGLVVFRRTPRLGLRALANIAGVNLDQINEYHFGFVLGPRLNAAGRLEHARAALEIFTTKDKTAAITRSRHLDKLNQERRRQQELIFESACRQAQKYSDDKVLVLSHPDWNHGIVGIVASKIVERYKKPALVLQEIADTAKGSARSLGDFSIVEAMRSADNLFDKYGGHHVAAGCTIKISKLKRLRQLLNKYYEDNGYTELFKAPQPDITMSRFDGLDLGVYEQLDQLAPFGMGNPQPLFYIDDARLVDSRRIGTDGKHLKLRLSDGKNEMEAIAFGQGEIHGTLGDKVKAWFELSKNSYLGQESLQLNIKELA